MSSPTGSPSDQHHGTHFNLGVDKLASSNEMGDLPHDWDPHDVPHRDHGGGEWAPKDSGPMQSWASHLDVPGI